MSDQYCKVQLWRVATTDLAVRFCETVRNGGGRLFWVPRSCIKSMVTREPEMIGGYRPCEVELAGWKAKELGYL